MFKIVGVDNFARENVSDIIIAEHIPNMDMAVVMVEALNEAFSGDHASRFYKVYSQNQSIYKFEP